MTTRAVRVDRADRSGRIFFAGGQVVHAEAGDLRGEPALFELIGWPDGQFTIEEWVRPYEETITRSWQSLLITAAHIHDETNAGTELEDQSTPPSTMYKVNDTALREVLSDPEVQAAAHFTEDGALIAAKGDAHEELHATFSYVVQLSKLIGESMGAENLQEIHIGGADYKALCVIKDLETLCLITSPKANTVAIAKRF